MSEKSHKVSIHMRQESDVVDVHDLEDTEVCAEENCFFKGTSHLGRHLSKNNDGEYYVWDYIPFSEVEDPNSVVVVSKEKANELIAKGSVPDDSSELV